MEVQRSPEETVPTSGSAHRTEQTSRGVEANVQLGRIAGIQVGLHWSVLVIWWLLTSSLATTILPDEVAGRSTAVYWTVASLCAVALLAGLLAHELSHAVTARHRGVRTEAITLWALGGVAELRDEPRSPRDELAIAVAGPATSIGLGIGFLLVSALLDAGQVTELAVAGTAWLGSVNLFLGVFNLLPGIPLDGGRILHSLLWMRRGERHAATQSAARVGRGLGYTLVALGVIELTAGFLGGLWLVLVGWFLLAAATAERDLGALRHDLGHLTVADVMTPHPEQVPEWISVSELIEEHVLRRRHSSFPVHDDQGRVTGLVTMVQVKSLDPDRRASTAVGEIAVPLAQVATTTPATAMVDLVAQLASSPGGRARRALVVVTDETGHERVVGIVTPTDISHAVLAGSLTHQ